MQLTGSVPVLACKNVDTALAFYQQALQFVVINQRKSNEKLEWVYLKSGEVLLMLEALAPDSKAENPASRTYIYTDDIKRLHHFLKARGYDIGKLRSTGYGMQEFDLCDPENHSLTIGQRVTDNC